MRDLVINMNQDHNYQMSWGRTLTPRQKEDGCDPRAYNPGSVCLRRAERRKFHPAKNVFREM